MNNRKTILSPRPKSNIMAWFIFWGVFIALIETVSFLTEVQDAKERNNFITEIKKTNPGIDKYVSLIENSYLETYHQNYHIASIQQYLNFLKTKFPAIDDFIIKYPSNLWIYKTRSSQSTEIVMKELLSIMSRVGSYSTDNLKRHIVLRNEIVNDCNQGLFTKNVSTINATNLTDPVVGMCQNLKNKLMLEEWQNAFTASGDSNRYYPYFKGTETVLGNKITASVRACNTSPYKVDLAFYMHTSPHEITPPKTERNAIANGVEWAKINAWYPLEPGDCISRSEDFIDTKPEFLIHANAPEVDKVIWVNSQVNQLLKTDDDKENDKYALSFDANSLDPNAETQQCLNTTDRMDNVITAHSKKFRCPREYKKAGFTLARADNDAKTEFTYFFQAPNLPILETDLDFKPLNIDSALKIAKMLSSAVQEQMDFDNNWQNRNLPFVFGADLFDLNGPFKIGVELTGIVPHDLFNKPVSIQNHDIITGIDGQLVWSDRDFNQALINHALSRQYGIEKPLQLDIVRGDEIYRIEALYFFNPEYKHVETDTGLLAVWYGFIDPIILGSPKIYCLGQNIFTFAFNGLLGILGSNDKVSYEDIQECSWKKSQATAFIYQQDRETFENAQWLGVFFPSIFEVAFENSLKNATGRYLGRNILSRAVANGLLAGIDNGLYDYSTKPLGTPVFDGLKNLKYPVGIGFASGFTLKFLTKNKGIKK